MGVEVDTNSIDQELKKLAATKSKIRNSGLKKAAEVLAERLKENTPKSAERRNKDGEVIDHKHMKDDIAVSSVDRGGEIIIGFGKSTYWRVHFIETGTIKIRPKAFIQRTEEEMKQEVMDIMVEEFRRGLGL